MIIDKAARGIGNAFGSVFNSGARFVTNTVNSAAVGATGLVGDIGTKVGQHAVNQTLLALERTGGLKQITDGVVNLVGRVDTVQVTFRPPNAPLKDAATGAQAAVAAASARR